MPTTIKTKKELVTSKMEVNGELDVNIDGYVHFYVDRSYGADADGHRGICRTFIEDVTNINAYDIDGNDVVLTQADKDRAGDELTTKFMEA